MSSKLDDFLCIGKPSKQLSIKEIRRLLKKAGKLKGQIKGDSK